jgi:hypothetical protein
MVVGEAQLVIAAAGILVTCCRCPSVQVMLLETNCYAAMVVFALAETEAERPRGHRAGARRVLCSA